MYHRPAGMSDEESDDDGFTFHDDEVCLINITLMFLARKIWPLFIYLFNYTIKSIKLKNLLIK